MKKISYFILVVLIGVFVASCSNSEYNLDNLVPDQYHKVVYFKNGGSRIYHFIPLSPDIKTVWLLLRLAVIQI